MTSLRSRWGLASYGLAGGIVLAMAAARWLLSPLIGDQFPFITFFPAVFLAAWLGGFGPGLFATLASAILAVLLAYPSLSSLLLPGPGTVGVALFVLLGTATAILGGSRLTAQTRSDAQASQATQTAERLVEEAAQQRVTQAALRASEARFRAMAQSSPLGIFLTEPSGDCVYTNPAYQRISGLSLEQAPQVVDLNEVARQLEPILRRTLTEQQSLRLDLQDGLAPVRADPAQLDQILLNLTINARDAMPDGGSFIVETKSVVLDQDYIELRPGITIQPGPYSALIVSDTGVGMDAETKKHLFEPFFTTKAVGKGSGLGLAMVYGIVKQSGGYIWAYSEPGLGSTFKLYFPSLEAAPAIEETSGSAEALVNSGGNILVVEDDPLVRSMARRALVEAGYQVLEAANGRDALTLAAENPVDGVLTDLAMPELGGRELAARLHEANPDLPVVFMSGYTDDDVMRRGLLDQGVPFLEKPLSPELLVRTMQRLLSRDLPIG